jgi:hypothetical protein
MEYAVSFIWFVFAILFVVLGMWHWFQSQKSTPSLKVTEFNRPEDGNFVSVTIKGIGIEEPLKDFVNDFNRYLDEQNKASHKVNLIAAWGYFVAAATAGFSLLLTWIKL